MITIKFRKSRLVAACLLCCNLVAALTSCGDADELSSESVITVDQVSYTEFDYWLQRNYVAPYNIAFKYRYEDNESDMNYYTVPSRLEDAVKIAHLVKYLCLEAYDETGGITFTRTYFPKLIFTIGEWEYNNNGTYILGTAEGGRKILLSGTNYIDLYSSNADDLNTYYIRTIHHEFTHILNQTKVYSADYKLITGSDYVADKWNSYPYSVDYLKRSFITNYAQHSDAEDFAEMLSVFVCNSEQRWNDWMQQAGDEGSRLISAKLNIVDDYMRTAFNINLYDLRAAVQRRQAEVIGGGISLTDLNN